MRKAYAGADDLAQIQAFNAAAVAAAGVCGYLHTGDIPHGIYNANRRYDPGDICAYWQDAQGNFGAWALLFPRFGNYSAELHPEQRGGDLETAVLDWCETAVLALLPAEKKRVVGTELFDCDHTRRKLLLQRGYAPAVDIADMIYTTRSLDDIPTPTLPDGFTIRSVRGPAEAAQLVEVHSKSFGSSWTIPLYERVMASPGYDTERELVAVAPDGRFAAFTIIWFDPVNRVGLFEPVGTHEEFRRLGLARALMAAGMRRMRAAGMRTATVCHEFDNPASTALYAHLGFRPQHRIASYKREVV